MRECCGANDHPDVILFIQMFKLASTYSLIKPPKGCNVEGKEILETLLSLKDIEDVAKRQEQWEGIIDTIIDRGNGTDYLEQSTHILLEHDYTMSAASEYALTYVTGYVSRKGSRFAKFSVNNKPSQCQTCVDSLILSKNDVIPERHKLIELKTKGYLKHPSVKLYDLISVLERSILQTLKDDGIQENTLLKIAETLEKFEFPLTFVGCTEHELLLTRRIIIFYLTMRMLLVCKEYNKIHNELKEKSREKRKAAKLTSSKACGSAVTADMSKNNCCELDQKGATSVKKSKLKPKNNAISKKKRKI